MAEGSLEAPTRHAILWREADFTDSQKIDAELRRVFDICHGCRRCFNLCDSFPRLFDLIDESDTGELDSVDSTQFGSVIDGCTLCDMCFMTKCPYVPPHEFDLDFPHLMLRYRAMEWKEGKVGVARRQLVETDRNGKFSASIARLANWASARGNGLTRPALQALGGVHKDANLPLFHRQTFERAAADEPVNRAAPAYGRKAVLYATCFVNYNNPNIGRAARAVLARNGIETEVVYPACCGMPQLEQGDLETVAASAETISAELASWIGKGYDIIALTPSCALMLKFEWPLIAPDDDNVKGLSEATFDIAEYVVDIAKNEGLAEGLQPLKGKVAMHLACHARAQNFGPKGAEMLNLIPGAEVEVIERCSGHGGSWGVMKENFEVAIKMGEPVAKRAKESGAVFVVSECPLAREHVLQGMERLEGSINELTCAQHPIQLMARAYGLS